MNPDSLAAKNALPPRSEPSTKTASTSGSLEEALERIYRLANQANNSQPIVSQSPTTAAAGTLPPNSPSPNAVQQPQTTSANQGSAAAQQFSGLLKVTHDPKEPMLPIEPLSLEQAGLNGQIIEEIAMRYLLNRGESPGRAIADQLKIPFRLSNQP